MPLNSRIFGPQKRWGSKKFEDATLPHSDKLVWGVFCVDINSSLVNDHSPVVGFLLTICANYASR